MYTRYLALPLHLTFCVYTFRIFFLLQTVTKYYSEEKAESRLRKTIVLDGDEVTLDIPEDGIKLDNGWSIVPMTHPASVSLTSVHITFCLESAVFGKYFAFV